MAGLPKEQPHAAILLRMGEAHVSFLITKANQEGTNITSDYEVTRGAFEALLDVLDGMIIPGDAYRFVLECLKNMDDENLPQSSANRLRATIRRLESEAV